MKNIFFYYLAITTPVVILVLLKVAGMIDSIAFVIALLGYALVYRTYIDGKRLAEKGIIEEADIWKLIVPGLRLKYFRDLYTH